LNYVDDSGLQVADIIVGFKFAGYSETPPNGQKFAHYCGDTVYVKTTQKYEEDKELESKRNVILKELEDKDSEISKFGQKITRNVLGDQLKTVWNLGVSYNCLNFESQIIYSKLWDKIFEKMKSQKLVRLETDGDNSGCWVMSVDGEDDKILVRSNGVATYVAKDIPYAAWKLGLLDDPFNYKKYAIQENGRTIYETTLEQSDEEKQSLTGDKVITVIDNRQKRLQNIVSKLMTKFSADSTYVHLGYEAVTLSQNTVEQLGFATDGKDVQMSGRKGIYINADEIIEKLEAQILRESKKRNQNLTDSELTQISHDVAIGTIRYEMIKPDLDKIITFDIDTSLKIEGDTCSYIQYSYARASRILEKSKTKPDFNLRCNIKTEHEINLIKQIAMFQIQVKDSANNSSPKVIARYCYRLAVAFSSFYEHIQVLNAESPELLNSRLCLVVSFQNTLKKALDLLGIVAPERM
jgi:arginyl-tRNA synthetase